MKHSENFLVNLLGKGGNLSTLSILFLLMVMLMKFGRYSCKFLDALVQDERGRLDCCIELET